MHSHIIMLTNMVHAMYAERVGMHQWRCENTAVDLIISALGDQT